MSVYLNSYFPIAKTKIGLTRSIALNIPPFVDASCRREPDLESVFPSITSLCRFKLFAPRLEEQDVIVYITHKGSYLDIRFRHWRLVAIIKVIRRFDSHRKAASWYRSQGLPLPSNCVVKGNAPLPVNRTAHLTRGCHFLKKWDHGYRKRAEACGIFLVCRGLYKELRSPAVITEKIMREVFGRVPGTRNPPEIKQAQLQELIERCRIQETITGSLARDL